MSAYVMGNEKRLNEASYGFTGRMGDAEQAHLVTIGGETFSGQNQTRTSRVGLSGL